MLGKNNGKRVILPYDAGVAGNSNNLYYDTATCSMYYWNGSEYLSMGGEPFKVLLSPQPTPTPTGNTTNLNSIFKDANGDSWAVDNEGNAISLGSMGNQLWTNESGILKNINTNEPVTIETTDTSTGSIASISTDVSSGGVATIYGSDKVTLNTGGELEFIGVPEDTDSSSTKILVYDPSTYKVEYKDFQSVGAAVTVGTNPPTGTSIEGAIHLFTDDGTPTGTVLEQYIYDTDSGVWIEMQRNAQDTLKFGTTSPTANGEWDGEEFFVTSTGDHTGVVTEQWIWDKQSTSWIQRPSNVANKVAGSILAANVCVNNVVHVPNGNPLDIKTVGTGGDFTDLATALASATVTSGTILRVLNDLTITATVNVNKAVVIDLNGKVISSSTTLPVNMFNITAGATLKNGTLSHLKTSNTSVETIITINSPTAPVYVINNQIQIQEFGIVARGQFYIGDNTFSYIGASATNSHRFIMLYGVANDSRIYNNDFTCSALQGTTRYSNFIYATSTTGTSYSGKLFINDNTQTGGDLRQFFLHDAGVPTGLELYVANNTFNDFNGGIGIFGVNVYNGYSKIGIYNNTQGADSAGNYKGLFFVDGTGAINENVVLEYGDNTLGTTALRPDYVSYAYDGSSEIALKNTITFVDKKEKVSIQDSLSDLGLLIQDLKSRKTYIEGASGSGTKEDPYIIIPSAVKIGNGGYTTVTNGDTTPIPAGGAGTMIFVGTNFFGFDGTAWRQLNN